MVEVTFKFSSGKVAELEFLSLKDAVTSLGGLLDKEETEIENHFESMGIFDSLEKLSEGFSDEVDKFRKEDEV